MYIVQIQVSKCFVPDSNLIDSLLFYVMYCQLNEMKNIEEVFLKFRNILEYKQCDLLHLRQPGAWEAPDLDSNPEWAFCRAGDNGHYTSMPKE